MNINIVQLIFLDLHIWNREETLLLINLYKENITMFDNPKISSKHCWNTLSE